MHTCVLVADEGDIYTVLSRFAEYSQEESTPESRWDYFGIGGRYEGALPLVRPRQERRFFGLLTAGETSRVSIAKKSEIDLDAFLVDPPAALFFRGQLYECPLFAEGEELETWQHEFRRRFSEIPDDTTLQVVDAHS